MKNIVLTILLLLSTPALAGGKWYVGLGVGQSVPKILLDEEITDVTVDLPNEVGGGEFTPHISTDSKFITPGQKLFVGYDIGEENGWKLEGSLMDFGMYEGTAKTEVDLSGVSPEGIPYRLSGDAEYRFRSDLYGVAFSVIYSIELGDGPISVFPRFGMSYLDGNATARATVNATVETPIETRSENWQETEPDELSGPLPVLGFGADIQLADRIFVRSEFERYGNPTEQPYVDMYTVSLGITF